MCAHLPARHTFHATLVARFQPTKTEAWLTEKRRSFYRGLAPSPIGFTDKRFVRRLWLSFSSSAFSADRRTLSCARSFGSLQTNSPRRPALNEPYETLTRFSARGGFGPNPTEGLRLLYSKPHPFDCPGSRASARVFPGHPLSHATWWRPYGIEPEDYFTT